MERVVFVLLTSVLFLTSCAGKRVGIKGDRNIVSQERTVSGFNAIVIDGAVNVNVQHGDDCKVVVITDNNLQDFVSMELNNNVLHINTKSDTNLRPTKLIVEICLPDLKSVNIKGVSNVKILDGNASNLEISLSGVGNIDTQNYQVENISINHSGVGNAKVWATNSLSGTLSGVGNISYKGSPMVNVNASGVGKVKKQ